MTRPEPVPGTAPLWWDDPVTPPGPPRADPAGLRAPAASRPPQAPAELPRRADVVIVGAGFTGLWAAYYLLGARAGLDVLVLEAEHVGFGASGRNGGWVSALWPVAPEVVAREHGAAAAGAMMAALRETVHEVGRVAATEGIDCGYHRGGSLALARSPAQAARAREQVRHAARWGTGTLWLDAAAAVDRLAATDVHGATFTPHCARVHPLRLVVGLAAAVRARGGRVVEHAVVTAVAPGRVHVQGSGPVLARHVIRATEAWTARLPGSRRAVAPVYSLMVATEPLDAARWAGIGLADAEVFADHRHLVVYGQRTVDDRIAFGGRGAPYHLGSRISPGFDHDPRVFAGLQAALGQMLPQLEGVSFTHAWGGPLGVPRDWHPSVGYDACSGTGWAGGYVGDGLAASNLAGRTLADLVLGRHTAITDLPWVGHRSPRWEPEPLRWLGVNAGLRLGRAADREEQRTGRPAALARVLARLTGH